MANSFILHHAPAPVIASRPGSDEPEIIVGPSITGPLGPCVCVGAGMTLPGQRKGLALIACLTPDQATEVADRILAAADEVRSLGGITRHG